METNFNQYPYNDDYLDNETNKSHSKNFHRILYKPGFAIQGRELTQYQSILQDQLKKFGDHIFDNYTVVSGAGITTNFSVSFLKLQSTNANGDLVNLEDFSGKILTNAAGKIEGKVLQTLSDDTPVLILAYFSNDKFSDGEQIFVQNSEVSAFVIDQTSEYQPSGGYASICSIDNGVYYIDGFFVDVYKQTIIIDPYSNRTSARIGLQIVESIVTSDEDESLLDPAVSASNFQGSGADRFKVHLQLSKKPLELDADNTFIEILRIQNSKIIRHAYYTDYDEIDDYFARRTFDTNGNFIVDKFNVSVLDNLNDPSTYYVNLGAGKGYFNGYIVENQSDLKITANKARTQKTVTNKSFVLNYGNSLYLKNLNGFFDFSNYQPVDIHCVKTANTSNTKAYQSTLAGTAKIKNIKYFGFEDAANSKTYTYETYFVDVQNYTLTDNATSVSAKTSTVPAKITFPNYFDSANGTYDGVYLKINNGVDEGDVLKISTYDGSTKTASLDKDFIFLPENTCNFSLLFDTKDFESIYNSNTSVQYGISPATNTALISVTSKYQGVDSGDVYFTGSDYNSLIFELGNDYIVQNSLKNTEYYSWMKLKDQTVNSAITIPNPYVFSFMGNPGDTLTDSDAAENFICITPSGELLHYGLSGNSVYISADSSSATIIGSGISGPIDVFAKVKVKKGNEVNISKKLKTKVIGNTTFVASGSLVTGTANTFISEPNGQVLIKNSDFNRVKQSLYVSDVISITKIIDTLVKGATPTTSMIADSSHDITNRFLFNNGQTDQYYDHSSIKLYPNAQLPSGDVFVIFDYFSHQGNGYVDNSSYLNSIPYEEIPQYKNNKGEILELRDCIDFRKNRLNGTAEFLLKEYGIKPTGIPIDGESFETDYDYYLGRKDLLVCDKDEQFVLIQGEPSLYPIEPNQPEGSITIAKFELDPYTIRVSSDARGSLFASIKIQTMIHKRWRMEDITSLEDRVSRIEYYTNLNNLEREAKELQILDEFGFNRFKNGLLVDSFSTYEVSNFEHIDFYSSIQTAKKRLFSVHNIKNFDLTVKDAIKSFGRLSPFEQSKLDYALHYDGEDAYVTLPYEKVVAARQPYASAFVNVNPFNVIDIEGQINLSPKFDAWVSNSKLPDIVSTITAPASNNVNRLNSGDYQTLVGADKNSGNNITTQHIDGFVTDASLYPWIRGQQLEFVGKGLLKNSLVQCYFDETNVTGSVREPNIIRLTTNSKTAFQEGDVLRTPSGNPFGKILYTTLISSNANSYTFDCHTSKDLDVSSYNDGSNTIQSVYLNSSGVISSIKGSGTITNITRKAGRILNQPSANSIIIDRFYAGEANTFANSEIVIIKENDRVGNTSNASGSSYNFTAFNILSATEYSSNDKILITVVESSILTDENYNTLSENQKKNFSYSIKKGSCLKVDSKGSVGGIFYLPKDTYHTGDRVFRIDNRIAENKGTDSTFAETKFFATNLNYNKQGFVIVQVPPPPPPCPDPVAVNGYASTKKYTGGGPKILVYPSSVLPKLAIVTGYRLRWKDGVSLEDRQNVNSFLSLNYPTNLDEFDTDTIVYRSDAVEYEGLSFAFSEALTVVSTYYVTDPKCGTAKKVKTYHDPVAQTFIFYKDEYPFGCFVKSIKTFFKAKPDDVGPSITCYISETQNGIPTKFPMTNASKTLTPEEVKTSEAPAVWDENTYTEFEFPVPVYIEPEKLYSFTLKTDTEDYEAYTARLGDRALLSSTTLSSTDVGIEGFKISKTPYIGELFKSQNAISWNSDGNEDLMFVIERCDFDVNRNPKVEFVVPEYLPERKLMDHSFDFVYGSNNYISEGQTRNSDFLVDAFDVSTIDLSFTEAPVKYSYRSTLSSDLQKETFDTYISPGKYGSTNFQEIFLDDGKGERILTANLLSTGAYSFSLYADLSSTRPELSPMISEMGLSLFGIQWKINNLGLSNAVFKIINGGTGYSNTATKLTLTRTSNNISSNVIVGTDAQLLPVANSTGVITGINVIDPGSLYASNPIIQITDPNRSGNVNAVIQVISETSSYGGNGLVRYITNPISLNVGFDAGDLRVYYTAYRPENTNIFVYYKILNRNDVQNFDDSDWQLMTTISGASTFSKKRGQQFEYVAAPYIEPNVGVASNKVNYTSKINDKTYNSFAKFAIKVVMSSSDPTIVPYLTDLRAIALLPLG